MCKKKEISRRNDHNEASLNLSPPHSQKKKKDVRERYYGLFIEDTDVIKSSSKMLISDIVLTT